MISETRLHFLFVLLIALAIGSTLLSGSALGDTPVVRDTNSLSTAAQRLDLSGMRESDGVSMWRSLGALLVVIGILLVAARFLKNRCSGTLAIGRRENRRMTMVERLAIDHKRQLVMVRVDDRDFVLAIGPDHISLIGSSAAGLVGKRENESLTAPSVQDNS
jgi:flagellar protein FliO/FliZ